MANISENRNGTAVNYFYLTVIFITVFCKFFSFYLLFLFRLSSFTDSSLLSFFLSIVPMFLYTRPFCPFYRAAFPHTPSFIISKFQLRRFKKRTLKGNLKGNSIGKGIKISRFITLKGFMK